MAVYCCQTLVSGFYMHCLIFLTTQRGKQTPPASPFYRWGNWVSGRWSDIPKITELGGSRTRMWTEACISPEVNKSSILLRTSPSFLPVVCSLDMSHTWDLELWQILRDKTDTAHPWKAVAVFSHHKEGRERECSFRARILLKFPTFYSQLFRLQVCWQRC